VKETYIRGYSIKGRINIEDLAIVVGILNKGSCDTLAATIYHDYERINDAESGEKGEMYVAIKCLKCGEPLT
jgi:CBS domain containing-hemolysin-like protein